jgi:hypothetical protein
MSSGRSHSADQIASGLGALVRKQREKKGMIQRGLALSAGQIPEFC